MDYLEKYLVDCDIDFSTARHLIGKKSLYSYNTYSCEAKRLHNEIFTIYKDVKNMLEDAERGMISLNQHSPFMKDLSYNIALVKITRSMNELLNDMLTTLVFSNNNLIINQSYRQMIEYFSIFFVISVNDDSVASFYMNHTHVIEAKAFSKMSNESKDYNLKYVYERSINLFALYHKLTFDEAKKIYSKPFGWAHNVIKDKEGNIVDKVTSKKIREFAFVQLKKELEWSIIHTSLKTSDEVVHPTPAYLFYLSKDDDEASFAEAIFNTSIRFYSFVLNMTSRVFNSLPQKKDFLKDVSRKIQKLNLSPLFEQIQFVSDYSEIKKINKYTYKNVSNDNGDHHYYLEHINQSFFSKDKNNKTTYKYLDLVYTLSDIIYLNMINFISKIVPLSSKWVNLYNLYWISSFLMHEMTVTFAFGNYGLFQKIFRLFVEYTAVLDYLIQSNESTNKNFFASGYLLLVHTHRYGEIKMEDYDRILAEIKARSNIDGNQYDTKILDFYGWTIHKNKKGKFVTHNFNHIISQFQKKIDPDKGVFKMIIDECNAALHGSLYAEEINNDIIDNSTVPFDYMMIIFRIYITIHYSITDYFRTMNDEKLLESNQFMTGTLIRMYRKYNKYVMKTVK